MAQSEALRFREAIELRELHIFDVRQPGVSLPFEPGERKQVVVKIVDIVDDCGTESLRILKIT